MTSNQGIIKGAGGSRVGGSRVVLSGARSLEEEEINLLKSFVETLRNSPNKTKVKRMLDGLALTSGELTDVARVLMNGLTVHAKESEEFNENRRDMKIAAGTIIKDCKKIIEGSKKDALSDDDAISVSSRNNESENDEYESDGEPVVRNTTKIKKRSRSLARAFINDEAEESEREDEEEEEEEEDVEELTETSKTRAPKKKDKTVEDKDSVLEDLERHDGGFIPLMKKNTEDVSGAITSRQVLITACFRPKYGGSNYIPSSVVGIGPGTLRMETELNEDGTVKKRGAKGTFLHSESSWFFYKGSLSENGNPHVPLKSGVRQTDKNHLEDLCANITVRAFSQGLFTMKQIIKSDERKKVEKKIIRWLSAEVNQGIAGSLETMMEEFRQRVTQQKNEEYESKRKAIENLEDLEKKRRK